MEKITTGTKICRECGRELPIGDFYVNNMSKDGHRNICKHCYIERKMQKRTNDPDHHVKHRTEMHEATKVCTECGLELPESEFIDSMGRRAGSGRCRACREKNREYQRKYREANRDRLNQYSRESNRRRRAGEEKRKPGPRNGVVFTKQAFTPPRPSSNPSGKRKPVKAERSCRKCKNWPCFEGIENFETDFASEGCHGWFPRGEAS